MYLVLADEIDCLLTELPVAVVLARVVDNLQGLGLKLETEAKIGLLVVGRDDEETRGDLGQSAPRHSDHIRDLEGREISLRLPRVDNGFEFVILGLVRREELATAMSMGSKGI